MTEFSSDAHPARSHLAKGLLILAVLVVVIALGGTLWSPDGRDQKSLANRNDDAALVNDESKSPPPAEHTVPHAVKSEHLVKGSAGTRTGWSESEITQSQAHGEDSFQKGFWGFALSEEEAQWMDRQGVPAPAQNGRSYEDMSLEKLMQLARAGDPVAARIGARRVRYAQWTKGAGAEIKLLSMPALAPNQKYQAPTDADRRRLETLMEKLFQTESWNQVHEFLWQGVVNGSSYAALEMRRAYWDASNTCYKPRLCEAWGMVAWRMGNWDAQPGGPVSSKNMGVTLSVSEVMTRANYLWAEINKARAERGLAPLQIDLRPNFDEWNQWRKNPGATKRIYRR